MDFPLIDLMDEHACYERLLSLLHPDGLACSRCGAADRLGVRRRHRDPVVDYQYGHCRRVFNTFAGAPLQDGSAVRPRGDRLGWRGQGDPAAGRAIGRGPRSGCRCRTGPSSTCWARRASSASAASSSAAASWRW